jgi:uncharacterized membrane protein
VALRSRRHANERVFVLAGLAVASVVCLGLEGLRELKYEAYGYRFLVWNLVLAWIPLLLSILVYDRYRRGTPLLRLSPAIVLWLLFLPNAPYILTDFIHLSASSPVPLWFDGATLSAFAWTGLLLGFVSLYLLHVVARHRLGSLAAWCCVPVVLGLVSAGVCLGRFLRWNSWDLLVQPTQRAADFAEAADANALLRGAAIALFLTCLLTAGYFSFYALVASRLDRREWPPAAGR